MIFSNMDTHYTFFTSSTTFFPKDRTYTMRLIFKGPQQSLTHPFSECNSDNKDTVVVTADVLKLEIWQECYAQIDTERYQVTPIEKHKRFGLCVCGKGVFIKSQPAASSFVLLISFVFNQSSVSDMATVPTTKSRVSPIQGLLLTTNIPYIS